MSFRFATVPALLAAVALAAMVGGASDTPPAPAGTPKEGTVDAAEVYTRNCAECHMADGSGVPNLQPALVGSEIIRGEPALLRAVIRSGSAALSWRPSDFGNEMPAIPVLTDAEVEALIPYLRRRFGGIDDAAAASAP